MLIAPRTAWHADLDLAQVILIMLSSWLMGPSKRERVRNFSIAISQHWLFRIRLGQSRWPNKDKNGRQPSGPSATTQNTLWYQQHPSKLSSFESSLGCGHHRGNQRQNAFHLLGPAKSAAAQMPGDGWPTKPTCSIGKACTPLRNCISSCSLGLGNGSPTSCTVEEEVSSSG